MFLNFVHDFEYTGEYLQNLGLSRTKLLDMSAIQVFPNRTELTNGVVLVLEHFRRKEKLPFLFMILWSQNIMIMLDWVEIG